MRSCARQEIPIATSVGRHFYQFYRGREDLFRVVIPFLGLGLANKEACLWVVSHSVGILPAVEALQRRHDLTHSIETGQLLILSAERWYFDRGQFSGRKVLEKMEKFIEEKKHLGFTSFRGVGDLGWLQAEDWLEFQAYEEKVHGWFQTVGMAAICAYPVQNYSLPQTQDVINHHHAVFQTRL